MASNEVNVTFSKTLFDLPEKDLLIPLGKYLKIRDIFRFRCCSRHSKELGDAMLKDLRNLDLKAEKYICDWWAFLVIIQQCHKLRKISLNLDTLRSKLLTDEMLAQLLSNNPLLEEVDLRLSYWITSKALTPLATCCKNLVKLNLDGWFDERFLEMLSEHNNHLLEVKFSSITKNFQNFFMKQPNLQRICLPLRCYVTGGTLSTIAKVCKDLNYLKFDAKDIRFYEDGLKEIADSCPKLHTIDFSGDNLSHVNIRISYETWNYLQSKNIRLESCEPMQPGESDDDWYGGWNDADNINPYSDDSD